MVCEAIGGYFAHYLGLTKTDPIDARMLALYGRVPPNLRLDIPPQPQQAALTALRKRQSHLKPMACCGIQAPRTRMPSGRSHIDQSSIRMLIKEKERLEGKRGSDHTYFTAV